MLLLLHCNNHLNIECNSYCQYLERRCQLGKVVEIGKYLYMNSLWDMLDTEGHFGNIQKNTLQCNKNVKVRAREGDIIIVVVRFV